MSIAILNQVYDEMRRLAIAGSVVAAGDFRLKKLIPSLEQMGAKAPVFTKVAEAAKKVVDGKEQNSAEALLELATLVNAILYTQGETGMEGTLQPIETTELFAPTTQTSARTLKPLLEALTTTGSGRLELIKDAYEHGAFRDLRLVKPSLQALDDGYAEVADFIAEKVLPLYGKAILPELRAKFDSSGRGGHPRRLRLLQALDPAGSREIVKQALDSGSKEVKVAAIECLGSQPEDLSYLIEQAAARAQEVRQAAYRALAAIDDDAAVAVLQKAMDGKDLDLAADSLQKSRNCKLLRYLIAAAEGELSGLREIKDKKEAGRKIDRLISLLRCLSGREDKLSEAFVLKAFAQRDDLARIKGAPHAGSDFNTETVHVMARGTRDMRTTLVEQQDSLPPEHLLACFQAARWALPTEKVYDVFSLYLTAKVDEKKKKRDPAYERREVILEALLDPHDYMRARGESSEQRAPALDPRWLDLAVKVKDLRLVRQLARPGHVAANAFLKQAFDEALKKSKSFQDCHEAVAGMVAAEHPEATDAIISVIEKHSSKSQYYVYYWFAQLIPDLPKSALPKLETLVQKLDDRVADHLLDYIQKLRDKQ